MSNKRELIKLLNRAMSALETPSDFTKRELDELIDDLSIQAEDLEDEADWEEEDEDD